MVLYDERGDYLVGGQLALETRKGRQIRNDRAPERHPDSLKAAKEMFENEHSTVRVRSLTSVYNCMGMVFGARRTCIDTDELPMILKDDEYRHLGSVNDVTNGDVVVYRDAGHRVTHVGLVSDVRLDIERGTPHITVLSQWGRDGEYFHRVDDVHQLLGTPSEYRTDRR
jgi:hypothetical protein